MLDTLKMRAVKVVSGSVLLVEDEEQVARSLGRMVEAMGYGVTHARTAAAAIDLVTSRAFDVVLTDLHLEGSSGMDVLAVARAYRPEVSLVLMTAAPTMETAIAAVNLGVVEYLLKPFERDQVKRALDRASQRRWSGMQAVQAPAPVDEALRERFEQALASLSVELEPICDAGTRDLVGFSSRFTSAEETLESESALVRAAESVGCLPELRRRARDLTVKEFASAPQDALLFVDIQVADLADEDLYSTEPPMARIADRVVLQLRGGFRDRPLEDVCARISVLRFIGYRIAIADLDGTQPAALALSEIAPNFARIDARVVRGVASSPAKLRVVSAITSMCETLDIVSIAEGVGCAEDRRTLVEVGCRLVTGSLLARHAPSSSRHPSMALKATVAKACSSSASPPELQKSWMYFVSIDPALAK